MENTEPMGWTWNLWGPQKLTFLHLVKNAHDWVSFDASSLEVFLLMSRPNLPLKGGPSYGQLAPYWTTLCPFPS